MSSLQDFLHHPVETLERALHIRRQIDQLNQALKELFGPAPISLAAVNLMQPKRRGRPPKAKAVTPIDELSPSTEIVKGKRKRRKMSAEGRARVAEAQKKRWGKIKGQAASPAPDKPGRTKKGKISAAHRAKLRAFAKARRARVKKSKG